MKQTLIDFFSMIPFLVTMAMLVGWLGWIALLKGGDIDG
jgi:hypothetical protein